MGYRGWGVGKNRGELGGGKVREGLQSYRDLRVWQQGMEPLNLQLTDLNYPFLSAISIP